MTKSGPEGFIKLESMSQEDLAKLIEQIRQELLYCEDPRDFIIWLADILNVDLE